MRARVCDSGSIRSSNLTAPFPSTPDLASEGGKRTAAANVFNTVFWGRGVSDAVSRERIGARPQRIENHGRRLLGVHGVGFGILRFTRTHGNLTSSPG